MIINSKGLAVAVIFGATVSPAMAADSFYAALDVGQTTGTDICTGLPAGVSGCKDTASLVRVAGGYQFTPMWGAEVSYGDYGKASAGTGFGLSVDWQLSGLQISGTGTFPIAPGLSLIGKLGIAQTDLKVSGGGTSSTATSTNLAIGVGAQYDFTKNISVRAQYEDLGDVGDSNTGKTKVTLLSAGVVFKF
jgi:OmpA-OmpF porin, OOP family